MVIAIVEEDKVVFAYTTGTYPVGNCDQRDALLQENLPFWKMKSQKDVIMAYSGFCREGNTVRYAVDVIRGVQVDTSYLHRHLLPHIRGNLSAVGFLDKAGEMNTDFLIAQGNKCYNILPSFCCCAVTDYCAIGSHCDIAMSLLEETKGMEAYERIHFIIKSLEEMDGVKLFPIATIDTKIRKLKIIER